MDVAQLIQEKLNQLGVEQRDLDDASAVIESCTSQLLSRKKRSPAPERTDIYDRLGKALKLPSGKLASLADVQAETGPQKFLDSDVLRDPLTSTTSRVQWTNL